MKIEIKTFLNQDLLNDFVAQNVPKDNLINVQIRCTEIGRMIDIILIYWK